MTRKLQLLRGTTVQNDAFTGSSGELTVDTDTHELRVHDGSTAGGHVIPTKSEVYTQTQADTILAGKANTSLSNLTSTGANIGNWSSNVTNCITYIPQDIKLELNNGTLTLKAGSKVYNGNGLWKTITADKTFSWPYTGSGFIFVGSSGGISVTNTGSETVSSLPTPATTYKIFYNTSDHKCYFDANNTAMQEISFPIGRFTANNGITSIDQVFNGFGYIGSTIYALPGVKGLVPNGRNPDGSLKNTSFTINEVHTATFSGTINYTTLALSPSGWIGESNYYSYAEDINYNIWGGNKSDVQNVVLFGNCKLSSGAISNFSTKTAFHTVDYSDYSNLVTTVNTKANDNAVVHLAGTETIGGYKYFSNQIRRDSVFGSSGTSLIEATDTNGKGFVVNQCFYANNAIVNRMAAYNATSQNWTYIDVWNYDNGGTYATAPASDGWGTILLTSAISKSQNGYVKLGNGIIIQWGHVDDPNNQHVYTVNLPTAFGSTNYKTMVITDHNTQSHSFLPNYINSAERTTTTFTVYRQGDARANSFEWIAIGY